jgi:hypothetical protein
VQSGGGHPYTDARGHETAEKTVRERGFLSAMCIGVRKIVVKLVKYGRQHVGGWLLSSCWRLCVASRGTVRR